MPKGKARKASLDLCQTSPEPQGSSMTRQAVAHRRGGTHRVKDQDRTDSVYDTFNYKELLDASKARGIYRKDMKKVEMAWALRHNDEERKREEYLAVIDRQGKLQQAKKEQERQAADIQKQITLKHRRRAEKERRRKRDESVSEDTMSEDEMEAEQQARDENTCEVVGQALSDESWESTATESIIRFPHRAMEPDCRLRLFEWPYQYMPLLNAPPPNVTDSERRPWQVPYAPVKVITTRSKQKLFLPGLKYPPGVDPDYTPILSLQTRNAARNGVLEGILSNAVVERATDWTARTQVQGWNARMYFHPPSRNETKDLAETYNSWSLKDRKLLKVKGKGDAVAADRERRHAERRRNRGRQTAEVYEACQWRPTAVCYVPAYLDYGRATDLHNERRSIENLFFIRFLSCDVPHYYFWTKEGEWADPTVRNFDWDPAEVDARQTMSFDFMEDDDAGDGLYPVQRHTRKLWSPLVKHRTRVKKRDLILQNPVTSAQIPNITYTINSIEHELLEYGLAATLAKYQAKWVDLGKAHAWNTFARALPTLYPSGQMPSAPPVEAASGAKLAVKLALIDNLDSDRQLPLSPLNGNEAWTRDDDRFWDVVEVDPPNQVSSIEEGAQTALDQIVDTGEEVEALYRRSSLVFAKGSKDFEAWLEQVSPSHVPPTPMSLPESVVSVGYEVEEWLETLSQDSQQDTSDICPFCCVQWNSMAPEMKAAHMLSHNATLPIERKSYFSSGYPLIALPPSNVQSHNGLLSTNTTKRRCSTQKYNNDSKSHTPPPQYLPDPPQAPQTPRKKRHSPSDSSADIPDPRNPSKRQHPRRLNLEIPFPRPSQQDINISHYASHARNRRPSNTMMGHTKHSKLAENMCHDIYTMTKSEDAHVAVARKRKRRQNEVFSAYSTSVLSEEKLPSLESKYAVVETCSSGSEGFFSEYGDYGYALKKRRKIGDLVRCE